jgi:hypothetical protein
LIRARLKEAEEIPDPENGIPPDDAISTINIIFEEDEDYKEEFAADHQKEKDVGTDLDNNRSLIRNRRGAGDCPPAPMFELTLGWMRIVAVAPRLPVTTVLTLDTEFTLASLCQRFTCCDGSGLRWMEG